jgi:hypothetical protein
LAALALASGCGKSGSPTSADGGGSGGSGGSGAGATGGSGGSATGQPISLDQLCAAFATDLCTFQMQCESSDFRDMAHCLAETDCLGVATLRGEVSRGAVSYDAAAAGACQARFQADPCHFASFLFLPDVFQVLADCPGTLTPETADGATCVATPECPTGDYCKRSGRSCPGTCRPYLNVGDSCAGAASLCAPGSFCANNTCRPTPQAGATCTSAADCGATVTCTPAADPSTCPSDNLWCDLGATNTCKKGVGLGANCGSVTNNGATTTVACQPSFWCDAFLNQAGSCRAFGGAGTPCNQLGCAQGLHCVGYSSVGPQAALGVCTAASASGGGCTLDTDCATGLYCQVLACEPPAGVGGICNGSDSDCQPGLFCATNTCMTARYPGESCADSGSGCVHGICRSGTCVDHAKAGEACTANGDCVSATCANGACADVSVCTN